MHCIVLPCLPPGAPWSHPYFTFRKIVILTIIEQGHEGWRSGSSLFVVCICIEDTNGTGLVGIPLGWKKNESGKAFGREQELIGFR